MPGYSLARRPGIFLFKFPAISLDSRPKHRCLTKQPQRHPHLVVPLCALPLLFDFAAARSQPIADGIGRKPGAVGATD